MGLTETQQERFFSRRNHIGHKGLCAAMMVGNIIQSGRRRKLKNTFAMKALTDWCEISESRIVILRLSYAKVNCPNGY